jgi:Tol biopolymer transport system component
MSARLAPLLHVALGALLLATHPAVAQTTARISISSNGTEGNNNSGIYGLSMSTDGRYVAYTSGADNLVPGDTNGKEDVFVRDTATGTTNRVSVATDGTQGNGASGEPSISPDGRYVAFNSGASNLVPGDTNGKGDVFVRDTVAGTTMRVSLAADGTQGNEYSTDPSISADGRYVAFYSAAFNLVPGDSNGYEDVFVRDTVMGTTKRISVATNGTQGNSYSYGPSISADGRYVAFYSYAYNLVPGDTNGEYNLTYGSDVFVRDMVAATTTRVSVASNETEGTFGSTSPSISADGRYVAFTSLSDNLVPGDTSFHWDIFVRDTVTTTTRRVSVASGGTDGNADSLDPSISANGRYVAFYSNASNLVPGDTNGKEDVFVWDTVANITTRVSVDSDGAQGNADSHPICISADGRYVAFTSDASNLVTGDTNERSDVFLRGPLSSIAPVSTFSAGGPVKSSPMANGGVIYFGDDAGMLHAVESATGTSVPGFPVDVNALLGASVKIQGRPAVYYTPTGPYIYFTTDRGDICRLTLDGSQLYHSSDYLGTGITGTPAVTPDGMVYVALSTPTRLGAIVLNPNMSTTAVTLSLSYTGGTVSSMSVLGNKVYMGLSHGIAGDILVLNAADLTPLSSGVANGEGVSAPPYVVGGEMYVGTLAGNFYKLNSSNNNVDTSFGTGGKVIVGEPLPTSPFFNAGAFYAGSSRGKVWRIGLNGSLSKAYDTGNASAVVGGVVVERGSNTLAFGTSAGDFYKVPLSGGDAGIFGPTLGFETTPTYDASTGRFFIGSDDGNVYGF